MSFFGHFFLDYFVTFFSLNFLQISHLVIPRLNRGDIDSVEDRLSSQLLLFYEVGSLVRVHEIACGEVLDWPENVESDAFCLDLVLRIEDKRKDSNIRGLTMSNSTADFVGNIENRGLVHHTLVVSDFVRIGDFPDIFHNFIHNLVILLWLIESKVIPVDILEGGVEDFNPVLDFPEKIKHIVIELQMCQFLHAFDHIQEPIGVFIAIEEGTISIDLSTAHHSLQRSAIVHVVEFPLTDIKRLELCKISRLHKCEIATEGGKLETPFFSVFSEFRVEYLYGAVVVFDVNPEHF